MLVACSVWKYVGQNIVMFIGAIASVDATLYEAAEIDGANAWHRFKDIILPSIRTIVVLAFSWGMVFLVGSEAQLAEISGRTLLFLVLSGLATGASWLCYFRALQLGDVNKVVPIDKSSTVLTILLAFFLLGEPIGLPQGIGVVLIGTGTFLMLEKRSPAAGCAPQCGSWMLYAFGSAVFASLTAILGKAGIQGVESNLGTAIRTGVVLVMAWLMVLVTGKAGAVRQVPRRELAFICLSGVATGASWLCYYRALQSGPASVVVPIDKLSVVITLILAWVFLHEQFNMKSLIGAALIAAGCFFGLRRMAAREFGGMSGDLAGYIITLSQLLMLLGYVFAERMAEVWF